MTLIPTKGSEQFPIIEPLKLDSKKTSMDGVVREVTKGNFSVCNSSPRVLVRTGHNIRDDSYAEFGRHEGCRIGGKRFRS
jgi:hypothetical protein